MQIGYAFFAMVSFVTPAFLDRILEQIPFSLREQRTEWVGVIGFSHQKISRLRIVAEGSTTGAEFTPQELFEKVHEEGFVLVHNHPSGSLQPSPEDVQLTLKVRRVCRQRGLRFGGHGIITRRGETVL